MLTVSPDEVVVEGADVVVEEVNVVVEGVDVVLEEVDRRVDAWLVVVVVGPDVTDTLALLDDPATATQT